VAVVSGLLLARYREIFFAMLSLALSMIFYGILIKAYWITGGERRVDDRPPLASWDSPWRGKGSASPCMP
jgi:branched-chain amino acid transport system permease protein